MTLPRAVQVQAVCPAFSLVHISFFQESWLSGLSLILIFQPNFIFFRIFLDFLVSVNIHVTKIIT